MSSSVSSVNEGFQILAISGQHQKAKPGTYINLHKYSKKIVQYGKNKKWGAINEIHLIEGKWRTYYVLEGNADTTYQKTNVKKLILNG